MSLQSLREPKAAPRLGVILSTSRPEKPFTLAAAPRAHLRHHHREAMLSQRPYGVFAMSGYARRMAFPGHVVDQLTAVVDIDPTVLVTGSNAADELAEVDILVTGWGSPRLDAEILDAAPGLKLVAHAAGSIKHHVTAEVWNRGIAVSSAAGANAEPVAEYTRAMILLACKRVLTQARVYGSAGWPTEAQRIDAGYVGRTIGIIGASRIGRRVIELLRPWGARILLADPYCSPEAAAAMGAESVDLDRLCRESDVISVHAPQLPETRHLIDDRRLSLMRDTSVLINTARGSLVDTDALVEHCETGRISAVLDVTEPEPLPPGHRLFELPNVTVTPHLAGAQGTEIALLGQYAVDEVKRFVAGEPLRGAVAAHELSRLA